LTVSNCFRTPPFPRGRASSIIPAHHARLTASETTKRVRAEVLFKKQEQMSEGAKAMAEYNAAQQAIREKTARLRALRLSRDAAHIDRF
jgi:hypothetical protein